MIKRKDLKKCKDKTFLKKESNFNQNKASVYICYSPRLIREIFSDYFKKIKTKTITQGTLKFNFKSQSDYPKIPISLIEESEYRSFHFVKIANRFYRRFLDLSSKDIFNIMNQEQVYLNLRYLISIIELEIKANKFTKFTFYSSSTGNKIVDKLFQRYYFDKFSIKIEISYFSKIIKPKKDLYYLYKRVSFNKSAIFYPIIRPFKINYQKNSNIGFIHHEENFINNPYNKLKNDLSINNNFISLNFLIIFQIGSIRKTDLIIKVCKYSIELLKKNFYKIIFHKLYGELIQTISNQIYYLCCKNTIEFYNLNSFIISYIDLTYENILYKACKDTNTTSIFYDYSMGYPGCEINTNPASITQIDFNREPDYVITNGLLRCNQYNLRKDINSRIKTTVINTICPQIDYARTEIKVKSRLNHFKYKKLYLSSKTKISIFDNNFGYNFYITERDVKSCMESLIISNFDGIILCHNKREGALDNFLLKSNLTYILQNKGDFTNTYYSDFIISIGFQSAAIKSAFAFEKPIIFFTENNLFFENANFFFRKNKNEEILDIIKSLTFNKKSFLNCMFNKKEYKNFLLRINKNTKIFLKILGLENDKKSAHEIINKIINNNERNSFKNND